LIANWSTVHSMARRQRLASARLRAFVLGALLALVLPAVMFGEEPTPVSFRRDVMAVLSKAGCNMGVCHGNKNGKGGFRLSLRGQDPEFDLAWLTHEQFGRRVDRQQPEQSLILLKPTGALAHQGGSRFEVGSIEYGILERWIAAGANDDPPGKPTLASLKVTPSQITLYEPDAEVALSVTAGFSDGTQRDVTRMAVYEPGSAIANVDESGHVRRESFGETTLLVRYLDRQVPVRLAFVPERSDFAWNEPPATNYIDEHSAQKQRSLRIEPSPLADDATFARRAYLDTLGLLPTADEARRFAADARPDKRSRLIDALLEREEFAAHWALKWSDLLRNEEKALDRKGVENFHHWIQSSLAEGKPLDRFVAELIAARGSTYENPPANFYRGHRDPITRAEAAAQVFLGVRLQCAKCHNHPFDRWTQDDYYGWAAFFARVEYKVLENNSSDGLDKHEFNGEQIVWIARSGEMRNARTGQPASPRLLGAPTPTFASDDDRLLPLSEWIASPENPFFAPAMANRIWFHLLGRGIVDPIDDFRATNPPSNPELLDALSEDLVGHGFDLRHLVRTIMNSRTYQRSAVPTDSNRRDEANFARAAISRLPAEVMLDALAQVTGIEPRFTGYPAGTRAGQIPGVQALNRREWSPADGDQFLKAFGKPARLLTCECERSNETTLNQAFQLVSGPAVNTMLTSPHSRQAARLAEGWSDERIIEEITWSALARPPTDEERSAMLDYVASSPDRGAALEDVLWGVVNSKEFLFRH